MISKIIKGIIYGEDYIKDDYQIIFGFYNDKFSNKDQLIDTIWKTGDYSNKSMKGETVNFFSNTRSSDFIHGESRTITISEKGITAGILHGSGLRFEGEVKTILRRNGEAQKLQKIYDDISTRKETAGYNEQKLTELVKYLREKYKFSKEAAINYVIMGDIPKEEELSIYQNLNIRIPQIAKETRLTHLTLLPVYDGGSSLEFDVIRFLAAKREGRCIKPRRLYMDGNTIPFDETIKSIDMIQ